MGSTFELRQIARNDPDPEVRIAAVRKLDPRDDEFELRQIARGDKDPRVRVAAVEKLKKDT